MRLALPRLAQAAGPCSRLPAFDLLAGAFAGSALGLLARPVQPLFAELANGFRVVGDSEAIAEEACDPVGRPQRMVPAVGLGPLQEQGFQVVEVVVGQAWGGSRRRPGRQSVLSLRPSPPAVDGGGAYAEDTGDDGRGFPRCDEFDGTATATLAVSSSSCGSHNS